MKCILVNKCINLLNNGTINLKKLSAKIIFKLKQKDEKHQNGQLKYELNFRPWSDGREPLAVVRPATLPSEHGCRASRLLHRDLHHPRGGHGHDPCR